MADQIKQIKRREALRMKVTTTKLMAGPNGVARVGTVLDLPADQAESMLKSRIVRPFDKERDKKAKVGFTKAPEKFE